MKPANAAREDRLPVEVAGLQTGSGLVGAVVEDHRSADAVPAVAVDRGNVRAADTVMREALVEGPNTHGADSLRDEIADQVIDHRRGDRGLHTETVRQVG